MRYHEIIEGAGATTMKIANQRKRISSAATTLASKEASADNALASAQKLPMGNERNQRIQAASQRKADARRTYNDTRTAADDRIRDLMSKK